MVAAEAFYRDNLGRVKVLHCLSNGCLVTALDLIAGPMKIMRAARGTGNGLGVKAAIQWIRVVGSAMRIEVPHSHCGVGAIVRQPANDAVTRAAIRAIDVGIVATAIVGIEEFLQALLTHRKIGRNSRGRLAFGCAFPNCEIGETYGLGGFNTHG